MDLFASVVAYLLGYLVLAGLARLFGYRLVFRFERRAPPTPFLTDEERRSIVLPAKPGSPGAGSPPR